jgi:tripartite-type tricarboxylate transporter receptor subunit TctC
LLTLRVAVLSVLTAAAGGAFAQNAAGGAPEDYPSRPLRIIVPFAPGGGSDIVSRLVGQKLAESLGQPVVVDNRPGGSGNIGHAMAAKAAPDGYTLVLGSSNFVVNPGLFQKNPYDAINGFAPITYAAGSPNVLTVHASFGPRTFREFVALARANPGKFNFASPGTGTTSHLAAALLKVDGGIDIAHVPYNGAGPAVLAIVGNQVPIAICGLPPVQPHIKSGVVRALGITSAQRYSALPDVPTIAESGFPGFEADTPQMFLAPAGTPEAVIARLNREIVRILKLPEVGERFSADGADIIGNTPQEFAAYIKSEIAKWSGVVKMSGARED